MSEQILKLLGSRIRELRKNLGLSQEQLAERAGFHYTYIGSVERAEKNISTLNLSKIATALEVGVYDLFLYDKITHKTANKGSDLNDIFNLLSELEINDVRKIRNIIYEMYGKKK
ncbi:MerR family transcriptional regulator [Paenibacillus sp. BK033]|uniref:helix-turn-helix domain-containing protein n=1 Tax=Paenibacillus sp. BK033 TaxID=2512133 RepID=UPI00104B95CB|nr:helix-turn-helix transcriptional regulator [Paenibacillus sp. BK033]TCM99448.1 MerR family transcriptional regulator [Paenibacillus sp. BK033]